FIRESALARALTPRCYAPPAARITAESVGLSPAVPTLNRIERAHPCCRSEGNILEGLARTHAATAPDGRSLVERFDASKLTRVGRLALYGVTVGAVAGLYYGAGRAGLHLAYLHGTVTALWPPVGVGVAALVILGPGVWPGIVVGDLLLADFSTPWGTIAGQTVGNTLEVVVAAGLFRRLAQKRISLARGWGVLALLPFAPPRT